MGVAFLPLHQYYNPGHANHGKWCIVLGKERAGSYAGKYNFIGGAGSAGEHELITLFREVSEELGLVLNNQLFQKSLIKHIRVKGTTFFGCHITGLSGRKWHQMMSLRKNCTWEYQEMDDIQHFPISDLHRNAYISSYVKQFIPLIFELMNNVAMATPMHYSQFVKIAPKHHIAMLQ